MRWIALISLVVAVTIGAALGWASRDDGPETLPPEPAPAAAAGNYRILTSAQSSDLLDFARAVRRCVSGKGVEVSAPQPNRTRISLAYTGSQQDALQALLACEREVGEPPAKSSLQVRKEALVLYLPKRCLLDPKVGSASAPS